MRPRLNGFEHKLVTHLVAWIPSWLELMPKMDETLIALMKKIMVKMIIVMMWVNVANIVTG